MDKMIEERVNFWLDSNIDQQDKDTINTLIKENKASELNDAFYKDLEFGTGGLRGIMGIGPNRMNKYTVGMATQGLCNYLKSAFPNEQVSVAIAHDSRNNSSFFAQTVAAVFTANDIQVHLFKELRPTPQLSYAIRHLKCKSGIVITASHNPREYNGYKVYWDDGAQIIAPHDKNIINEVRKIKDISEVKFAGNDALIHHLGETMDDSYLDAVQAQMLSPECVEQQRSMSIVYSSIHGTGITMVPKILDRMGFDNVSIVDEQATPDGDFPTVVYPNPEEEEAMTLALNKAREVNADLVMATDPDSDRVGVAVKNLSGEFQLLNGNQTGALIIYYLCKKWSENKKLTGNQYIVKTIVTTELIADIAKKYEIPCYDTLTGFKHIAGVIRELEGKREFIGGGEESYGYMIGDFVRDKDAVASCAIVAEMVAWAKEQGMSPYELLVEISHEFGMYLESLVSLTKKGQDGAEEISGMMKRFRSDPPLTLAGIKVSRIMDYQNLTNKDLINGTTQSFEFTKSNVLQLFLEDDTKISMRPSGTEPKIKFYFSVRNDLPKTAKFDEELPTLIEKINAFKEELDLGK